MWPVPLVRGSSRGLLHSFYEGLGGVEEFAREGRYRALQELLIPLNQLDLYAPTAIWSCS